MEINVDGRSAYVYTGTKPFEPGRRTWLFVHGAGMDHSTWVLQSRYFAFHGDNVLAPDLPGHGRSAGEPPPTIAAIADWLDRMLDTLEIPEAVVVGHSMGSLATLELAARYPGRVQSAVLVGAGYPMAVAEPLLAAARANDHSAVEMVTGWGLSPQSHLGGNPVPGLWLDGQVARLLEAAGPGVLHAGLNACNEYADGESSAAAVHCPVHFVVGERDMMTPPRAAETLRSAMTVDATRTVLSGCGHMIMLERPDALLDELIAISRR
ncbi:alpha/beta hydrolase [Ectothiorhodospiraceae bacterium WFHF3C12]|nr:alpha/beta hydrolase [Ectothiorhodospiraceae bacterium WFHF3C12]